MRKLLLGAAMGGFVLACTPAEAGIFIDPAGDFLPINGGGRRG